jgi:membrane protein implicated in regulation of membrane protease activity
VLFYGLLLRAWWLAGAAAFALYVVINIWLWPKASEPLSEEG